MFQASQAFKCLTDIHLRDKLLKWNNEVQSETMQFLYVKLGVAKVFRLWQPFEKLRVNFDYVFLINYQG